MVDFPDYVAVTSRSFARRLRASVQRSEFQRGPDKQRKVRNKLRREMTISCTICNDNVADFDSWIENDLGNGAGNFRFLDPVDGIYKKARLISEDIQQVNADERIDLVNFTLDIEVLS